MPYYLNEWVRGPARWKHDRAVRCIPAGWDQVRGWKQIDQRADGGATLNGAGRNLCFFYSPQRVAHRKWILIGEHQHEAVARSTRRLLQGLFPDAQLKGNTLATVLGESSPWSTPNHTGFVPFSLGPIQRILKHDGVYDPSIVLRDESIARDFQRKSMRPKLVRWFGVSAVAAALTYWQAWEALPIVFAALPQHDDFTGTNGTDLITYSDALYGANLGWAYQSDSAASMQIRNNGIMVVNNADSGAYWKPDAFNNDQYAQAVIGANWAGGTFRGVGVRLSTSAATRYGLHGSSNAATTEVFKIVTGTFSTLDGGGTAFVAGDTLKLSITGTSMTATVNGSAITGITNPVTDAAIASGQAGLVGANNDIRDYLDSWDGGNVSSGPGAGADNLTVGESEVLQAVSVTVSTQESG